MRGIIQFKRIPPPFGMYPYSKYVIAFWFTCRPRRVNMPTLHFDTKILHATIIKYGPSEILFLQDNFSSTGQLK